MCKHCGQRRSSGRGSWLGQDGRITALVRPDGGAEEPWSVTFCVAWWHAHLRSRSSQRLKQPRPFSNTFRMGRVRVRRTRDASSHRFEFRGHRRVHTRHRGTRSDLPESDAGRFVVDGKWRLCALIRAQFLRAQVNFCVGETRVREGGEQGTP